MALIRLNTSSAPADTFGGGKILQVQYTQFTGTPDVPVGGATEVEFTQLSLDITPASTSSVIKLEAQVFGEFANRALNWNSGWYFRRSGTSLRAPAAGNRGCSIATSWISHEADSASTPEGVTYGYFDTPNTTSQITYRVAFFSNSSSTFNLNHTHSDLNSNNYERLVSFISATEISG